MADGLASGSTLVEGYGTSTVGAGLADGTSVVGGVSVANSLSPGIADGSTTVGGAGAADTLTAGASDGTTVVSGAGTVNALAVGASDGSTVVSGAGYSTILSAGLSEGTSVVMGLGLLTDEYSYPATAFDQGEGATYTGTTIDHSGSWAFGGWFYVQRANGSGSAALMQLKGSSGQLSLYYHWGYRRLSLGWSGPLESGTLELTTALQDGWNFIAIAYDGSTVRAYLKRYGGPTVKVREVSQNFNDTWDPNGVQISVLGAYTIEQQYWKIWSEAYLTQYEVEAESNHMGVQKTANIYAYYPLIEGNLDDYSGNGRGLTPIGAPSATFSGPLLTSFSMGLAEGSTEVLGAGILADLTKGAGFCEAYADGLAEGSNLASGVSLPTGTFMTEAGSAGGDSLVAGVGFFGILATGAVHGATEVVGHAEGTYWTGLAEGTSTCDGQGFVTSFSAGVSAGRA